MHESIIECFTCSKTGEVQDNEDGVFIGDDYIAVIDGATSKTATQIDQKTGGQFVRDCIIDSLAKMKSGQSGSILINEIHTNIVKNAQNHEHAYGAASAIIYCKSKREIWSVGDCQAYIGNKHIQRTKLIDSVLSEARAFALNAMLENGISVEDLMEKDPARDLILPFLVLQTQFENEPGKYGYSVFNTKSAPLQVDVYSVPSGSTVVLASDGYPVLKQTLAASEEELAKLIQKDPLMCKCIPATKGLKRGNISFDDRTYIRFVAD